MPNDAVVNPVDTTHSLAKGARMGGTIGMGYLENPDGITDDWILEGRYEIGV